MQKTVEEIVKMVSVSYAQRFDGVSADELAQEIWLRILHGKAHSYDPTRGNFEPYARAIANRTAQAFVYSLRCPVHGRASDVKKWKHLRAVTVINDGGARDYNQPHKYRDGCDPQSPTAHTDDMLWSNDVVSCLQQIFDAHAKDGELAREVLIEHRSAEDVAKEHDVSVPRIYRATCKIRRAIKAHPRARLLWETR